MTAFLLIRFGTGVTLYFSKPDSITNMKAKRFYAGLIVLISVITACSKDDDSNPAPAPAPAPVTGITAPPASFTKKVLLEYHTAAWCGSCPDAEVKRDQVTSAYPGKVIPVAYHQSDAMQIPLFMTIDATFGSNPAYGMVNRTPSLGNVLLNRTQWLSNTSGQLSGAAKCGLAINSAVAGNSATIEVQAAFRETLAGAHTLTVYLVENDVAGTGSTYDQMNNYNADPSSPYYNLGNPIIGFKHQLVARKVLTANLGDAIDASKLVADGLLKKNFTVDLTGLNKEKVYVIAFVNKTGTSATTYEILNVQQGKLGVLRNWD